MIVDLLERAESPAQNFSSASDEELVRRCARGDRESLRELSERYQTPMCRFLSCLIDTPGRVETLLPRLFVQVWQEAPCFPHAFPADLWLYRLAIHTASLGTAPQEQAQEARAASNEKAADWELHIALQHLPFPDRALLALFYREQLNCEQIQTVLNLPALVLKARLSYARKRMLLLLSL